MCDARYIEDVIELKQLLLHKQRSFANQVQNQEMSTILSEGVQLEERQIEMLSGELNRLRGMEGTW